MRAADGVQLIENEILVSLPQQEREQLLTHAECVSVHPSEILYQDAEPISYIYFPHQALISEFTHLADGTMIEVTTIGGEGVLGLQALLGSVRYPKTAIVQIPGRCSRMRVEDVLASFRCGGTLQQILLRYTRYMLVQISQTAACNRIHLLQQRFSRWLLKINWHAHNKEFPATHESISQRLGVPRSEVSLAARILRDEGAIDYQRGVMKIVDQQVLEASACECYQTDKSELEILRAAYSLPGNGNRIPRRPAAAAVIGHDGNHNGRSLFAR